MFARCQTYLLEIKGEAGLFSIKTASPDRIKDAPEGRRVDRPEREFAAPLNR